MLFRPAMKITKNKMVSLSLASLLSTSLAFAAGGTSATVFGLPTSVAADSPTRGTSETVGSLSYTNQWIQEKNTTYLYIGYNSASLASPTISENQYTTTFSSNAYSHPSVDLFTHFFSFAGPEARSWARDLSVWGRYSLGIADRKGYVSSSSTPIDSSVTSDSLLIVDGRIGLLLGFDRWSWFRPYVGLEISPYMYRNTADINGAEQQGGNMTYGSVFGAHFPIFFSGRGSILGEYRRTVAALGTGQLFSNANNFYAGMGLAF